MKDMDFTTANNPQNTHTHSLSLSHTLRVQEFSPAIWQEQLEIRVKQNHTVSCISSTPKYLYASVKWNEAMA